MILKFNKVAFKSIEWEDGGGLTLQNVTESATYHGVIVYKRTLQYHTPKPMMVGGDSMPYYTPMRQ